MPVRRHFANAVERPLFTSFKIVLLLIYVQLYTNDIIPQFVLKFKPNTNMNVAIHIFSSRWQQKQGIFSCINNIHNTFHQRQQNTFSVIAAIILLQHLINDVTLKFASPLRSSFQLKNGSTLQSNTYYLHTALMRTS